VWLTRELQDSEFQTSLVAGTVPPGEEDMSYFATENGVVPIYVEEMSRELSGKDIVSVYKIYRHLRRESPDIIHTHTAKAGTVGRVAAFLYRWLTWKTLIAKPRRLRTVHTFHGHVFHSYYGKVKTRFFLTVEKILARTATDKIIVISAQQLSEIHDGFNVGKKSQFQVIPLGIDLESFEPGMSDRQNVRREIGAAQDDIAVGFVGRLTEIKNVEHLLRVAALYNNVLDKAKSSLKFVIIGDGQLRQSLEQKAREFGIADILTFLGHRNDTVRLYAGLDIVALASLNEGTPLSLIEAMASGRAIISTLVGGVTDLLGDVIEQRDSYQIRERGVGVEAGSVEAYLEGLIYLADNEKLREKQALLGRQFVEENYGKQRLVEDIKRLYRELA